MLHEFLGRLRNRLRLRERLGWAVPSNYGRIRANAARIEEHARYAMQSACAYAEWLPRGFASLQHRSVLEVGPGLNFGVALLLKCAGARRVAVTDRFLARYQSSYHGRLYRAIREMAAAQLPALDLAPFDAFIAGASHASGAVECIEMPLERVAEQHAQSFDVVLSNAVLEHVYDPGAAAKSLYAVLAPGGKGYHQVDFRDHHDFSHPLEYLLQSERDFRLQLERSHCEWGNRFRPHELETHLRNAGFAHPVMHVNMRVAPDYMQSFLPRLRAARHSPYCTMDAALLEVIGARFELAR